MNDLKPAEVFPPGEFIREELEERGWTQADLAKIMGRPVAAINLIINGNRAITPETAIELADAFGTSASLWLNLETAYQLSRVDVSKPSPVKERAKLYKLAPVKDLENRGWIKSTNSSEEMEDELKTFFSLPEMDKFKAAARSSIQDSELTPEQMAWCVRALWLAKSVPANAFTDESFSNGLKKLRELANFPENARKVPRVLSEMGIRFIVIEHLPKSKIDGAALWLGEGWDKPVIALSMRYDRIDSFWHTLFHECSHIKHRDTYIVDVDMVDANRCLSNEALSQIESRANDEAADFLIPKVKMDNFIDRTHPFYYTEKIIQFANMVKIHPGIIAGQLQHKKKITWSAHRKMLVKVRDILISAAMTDGWGMKISN